MAPSCYFNLGVSRFGGKSQMGFARYAKCMGCPQEIKYVDVGPTIPLHMLEYEI